MEITHDHILSLGLIELYNRPGRYEYKGVIGRLSVETGTFHLYGFGPAISTVSDLKYLLMLIDYQEKTETCPS